MESIESIVSEYVDRMFGSPATPDVDSSYIVSTPGDPFRVSNTTASSSDWSR